MDNEELFENFNFPVTDTINQKEEKNILLSKKRNIEHEKEQNLYSNSDIINKYNKNQSKEKQEDLLLMKEIQSIKESIRTEENNDNINNDNNNEEEKNDEMNFKINNIPDKEVKIITTKFEGGFHELIYPINIPPPQNTIEKIESPATTYPFKLDQFQEKSILCLENHQSVLVSAHTSAGKTVVAQYAIAMSLRDHQRVIYTSPIKALSNQKYRELCEQFDDVGLMTGDVTININASCIVMTTEILRNMLYKGSEMIKEIAWVIFDEVHYMRDKIRGVVWEETMILLSNKINYVFLSATIPNAREFAMWISLIKNQPCNVIYTEFRPVPLKHYVYPSASDDIILVVDDKGNFKDDNFNRALAQISTKVNDNDNENINNKFLINDSKEEKKNKNKTEEDDIKALVDLITNNELDPAIIFCFSKEKCESLAKALQNSGINLTTDEEKKTIEEIYICAMLTLSEEDQNIPQFKNILNFLKLGIGVHHGGMIPLIRECVELIFQSGLIKILFSTETFSMGLNMPAKTVVFSEIEKFDGNKNRYLTGGEYIQMSGRAGRRGLDQSGVVIVVLKKKIDPDECRGIMRGKSDPLNSSFILNYNQILNLSRIEGIKCEFILEKSFRQYQSIRAIPLIKKNILRMYNDYIKYGNNWERDELINETINILEKKSELNEINRAMIFGDNSDLRKKIKPYLVKGRFIYIKNFGIGIFVDYCKVDNDKYAYYNEEKKIYEIINDRGNNNSNKNNNDIIEIQNNLIDFKTVYLLIYIAKSSPNKLIPSDITSSNSNGKLIKAAFKIHDFEYISNIKISLPENITSESSLKQIEKIFKQISLSLINKKDKNKKINYKKIEPIKDMKISDKNYIENNKLIEKINSELNIIEKKFLNLYGKLIDFSDSLENIISKNEFIVSYKKKISLRSKIKYLISELYALNRLVLNEELIIMKKVLSRLNYLDKNNLITFKGQIGCNITSADTIILTEILFNGFLNNLNETDIGVILSCFVGGEGAVFKKDKQIVEEDKHLMKLYNDLKKEIEAVVDIYIEYKINIKDKERYIKMFRYDFMKNILFWINGDKTFGEICDEKNSEIYGGSMVRCIRRLDELLKELINCADMIGNNLLKEKFENISKKIKRGVPFSASLYLSNENQ